MMPRYFVDTSFWVALINRADGDHQAAVAWCRHVTVNKAVLVATHAVLWELANTLCYRSVRQLAAEIYRRSQKDPDIEIVRMDDALEEAAISLFESRRDKDWSLTDCLSFVVMQRCGLRQALTADHHFQQAGFEALLLREPPV